MSLLALPARLTVESDVSIVDALVGEVIVTLTAAPSTPSFAGPMRQALTDNASSNVSTCCATDRVFIIPGQLRIGRQTRVRSATTAARDGTVNGHQWEITKNAVKRQKNNGGQSVPSLFLATPLS